MINKISTSIKENEKTGVIKTARFIVYRAVAGRIVEAYTCDTQSEARTLSQSLYKKGGTVREYHKTNQTVDGQVN